MIHDNYRSNPAAFSAGSTNIDFNDGRSATKNLLSLKSAIGEATIAKYVDLGIIQIPVNHIVGYVTEKCSWCEEASYMCCCEYLGDFYIYATPAQVSLIQNCGAFVIWAHVMRMIPVYSQEKRIRAYYDFLSYYSLTGMYQIQFTQPGFFEKLQKALGYEAGHSWSIIERSQFMMKWLLIESAFQSAFPEKLNVTAADALMVLLEEYSFSQITSMPSWILTRTFHSSWKKLHKISEQEKLEENSVVLTIPSPYMAAS